MAKIPTKDLELWLLGWNESHNGGCKVTFQLSPDDLEYFRAATVSKGKVAGQRYQTVFVELGPNEEPVDTDKVATPTGKRGGSKFPSGRAGLAVRWCDDLHFQSWVLEYWPEFFEGDVTAEQAAKNAICKICGVTSRKDLDAEPAATLFDTNFREPYSDAREADGVE